MVSAPPGSGKTVLLRSWLEQPHLAERAAWVTAGREEHDPQRFWLSVAGALRRTAAGSVLVQPVSAAPGLDGWAITERLLTDLASLAEPLWLVIDDVHELPQRFGQIDVALLPTNGLCIRPLNDMQVVMNAQDAAELTAVLRPKLAIPHHYAFTSGWLGDRILTKKDNNPYNYAEIAARLAPETKVRIVEPGTKVTP
jgi:hypothetical protein